MFHPINKLVSRRMDKKEGGVGCLDGFKFMEDAYKGPSLI
jgi:hypothetical protein